MENLTKVLEAFKDLADSASKLHAQALENANELENLLIIDLIKKGKYYKEFRSDGVDNGEIISLSVGDYTMNFVCYDKHDNEFISIEEFCGDKIDPSAELQTLIEKL